MTEITTFEDLFVWQKAMTLAELVHGEADSFPSTQRFGLGAQMRRSATSIPSNVAEGFSRRAQGVYRSHVAIAMGSAGELRTQIELSRRLKLLSESVAARLRDLVDEVGRMLYGLWKSLLKKTVCYSVVLAALILGLGPWAWGLIADAVLVFSQS